MAALPDIVLVQLIKTAAETVPAAT